MRTHSPADADIRVYTFKEGLLSTVAHDLQIRATRFEIVVDPNTAAVRGRIEAASLEVVCAMKDGREDPGTLSAGNKADIQDNMRKEVLNSAKFLSILFESTRVTDTEVTGRLTLRGVTREIRLSVRVEGDRRIGEARLDQRDWGIKPYSALLGALKIQPEVKIVVSLPL